MWYKNKSFILDIGDLLILCSGNYEEIEVEGYSGSIICPDYNRVCTGNIWYNDPLSCVKKVYIMQIILLL